MSKTLFALFTTALLGAAPLAVIAEHHQDHGAGSADAVAAIDLFRDIVESHLDALERKTVSLDGARAQVRQKWSAMDAYSRGGSIVRIKLYPHEGISERTEEFYYRDGNLLLVFVEDAGADSKGPDESREGKTYYFLDGKLIREENATGEAEVTGTEADAARLLQEANEYLSLAAG